MMTPEEELMSRSGCDGAEECEAMELAAFDYPPLAEAEHRWIEARVGRTLTTEEAQLAIREATIQAAWEAWIAGRGGQ